MPTLFRPEDLTAARWRDRVLALALRLLLRCLLKPVLSPRWSFPAQRRWLLGLAVLNRWPAGISVHAEQVAGVNGEWLRPTQLPSLRPGVVLYLHGGAFCVGNPRTHRPLCARLARDTGLPTFALDYRLAPEHPFPAALDDAEAVFRALAAQGPVLVVGDSAGGTLALLLAQRLRDAGGPQPTALALLSPVPDLAMTKVPASVSGEVMLTPAWLQHCFAAWCGARVPNDPMCSPRHADLAGLPPTLVQWGQQEILAAACAELVDALRAAEVRVEAACWAKRWHVFQLHANTLPSADAAISQIARCLLGWLDAADRPRACSHEVLILGAGMSGLCMLRQLKAAGQHDVLVLEQQPGLGGTWWDNTYPGAQVDVPAPAYAFSFAPNPNWQQRFATAGEIQRYQQRLAEREGLVPHLRLGTRLVEACWDPGEQCWLARTAGGLQIRARHFVCSTGPLSQPRWPDLPGLSTFAGLRLHSARWDHQAALDGRRIGVIGTGSTAVQLIPPLAARAAHLTVFQRTPNWILPRLGRRYRWFDRLLARLPGYPVLVRAGWVRFLEWVRTGFDEGTLTRRLMLRLADWLRRWQLADPALRAALTPNYPLGCKRLIFANDYYPVFNQPHVTLETVAVRAVTPTGIVLADGREVALDVLVCATGFDTVRLLSSLTIRGRDGQQLSDAWRNGPEAFHGIAVPGFPNFHLLLGPNTATGHTSTLLFIEPAVQHVLAAMAHRQQAGAAAIDVKAEVFRQHNDGLQARLQGSVWAQCQSWYRADNGRVVALFPGQTPEYVHAVRFNPTDYDCTGSAGAL